MEKTAETINKIMQKVHKDNPMILVGSFDALVKISTEYGEVKSKFYKDKLEQLQSDNAKLSDMCDKLAELLNSKTDSEITHYWKRKNCFGQYLEGLEHGSIWMRDELLTDFNTMKEAMKEGGNTNG